MLLRLINDHADLVTSEGECDHPFSFFYLSSEDCRDGLPEVHNIDDVDVTPLDPVEPRKQATSHINVTSEEVARTTGEQREQWLEAGRKEIDNLTSKRSEVHKVGALEPINATERDKLKSRATIDGYQYIELPAKGSMDNQTRQVQVQDSRVRQSDSGYLWQNFYHRPGHSNAALHTLLGSVIIRTQDGVIGHHGRIPQCRIAARKGSGAETTDNPLQVRFDSTRSLLEGSSCDLWP